MFHVLQHFGYVVVTRVELLSQVAFAVLENQEGELLIGDDRLNFDNIGGGERF